MRVWWLFHFFLYFNLRKSVPQCALLSPSEHIKPCESRLPPYNGGFYSVFFDDSMVAPSNWDEIEVYATNFFCTQLPQQFRNAHFCSKKYLNLSEPR